MTDSSLQNALMEPYASSAGPTNANGAVLRKRLRNSRMDKKNASTCSLILSISAVCRGKISSFFLKVWFTVASHFSGAVSKNSSSGWLPIFCCITATTKKFKPIKQHHTNGYTVNTKLHTHLLHVYTM